jgi:preprotein translocase SecE subunit
VWPFVRLFGLVAAILRPFSFLLAPFRTRPARAIGRFLASVLLFRYFRNSWKELRQVQWPNARDTTKMTFAVFAFAVFFSLIVSLADWAIGNVVEKLIIN